MESATILTPPITGLSDILLSGILLSANPYLANIFFKKMSNALQTNFITERKHYEP